MSEKNPMGCLSVYRNPVRLEVPMLLNIPPYQVAGAQNVGQQKTDAGENVVLIVRAEILKFAEVVEGDGDGTVARIVELEVGCGDAVIGGEHFAHDDGGGALGRDGGAGEREEEDIALQDGLHGETAIDLYDAQHAFALFGDRIAPGGEQFVNLPESGTCCWSHIRFVP